MYIERNIISGNYGTKDFDDSEDEEGSEDHVTVWVISQQGNVVKPYTYDEAISLAGHGPYSVGLLRVCSLCLLAMTLDISSFPTIIDHSACDLRIGVWQRKVLMSMPFLGALATAYAWGFVCNTRGRKRSLLISMWGSFIASTLSVLSPHWIVLAVLKFISVCFCSCAMSATFTLIAECCPVRVKRTYLYILASSVHPSMAIYTALGYLSLSFDLELNLLNFTSWRLLDLVLALPLGISAISLHFYYESPKFLINIGKNRLALEILENIWRRNKCVGNKYPVKKVTLEEEGNIQSRNMLLLQSLWEHTKHLFRMPLLLRTLQLYFLIIVLYNITNIFIVWIPHISKTVIHSISARQMPEGTCKIIDHLHNLTETDDSLSCVPKLIITDVWVSALQGLTLIIINISIITVTNRKIVVIITLLITALASAACVIFETIISIPLFFIISSCAVVTGVILSYFVDLYPTSLRSMAGCLVVAVASGSNLLGHFITDLPMMNCAGTFNVITAHALSGVLLAYFLPSDRSK